MKQGKSDPKGKRETTVDARLAELLIREIIVRPYPPGTPLREQEIADRYGVSRPSTREALRLMAYAGFVDILPWRGARVIEMSFDQFLDILGLLEDIYARCAALAAHRMPEAVLPELRSTIQQLEAGLSDKADKALLYRLSFTFGGLIGEHCGSAVANRLLNQVGRLALWQQRLRLPGTPESEKQSLDAHRLLASAIEARQPEVAAGAARTIVLITRRTMLGEDPSAPVHETESLAKIV
jgi:DNA-binding GntR family transcriptional regulator